MDNYPILTTSRYLTNRKAKRLLKKVNHLIDMQNIYDSNNMKNDYREKINHFLKKNQLQEI